MELCTLWAMQRVFPVILIILLFKEKREFFHVYNSQNKKCLSVLSDQVHAENCDLNACQQKWMWTKDSKLSSILNLKNEKCISGEGLLNSSLYVKNCSQTSLTWECIDVAVKLKGHQLYLSTDNDGIEIKLLPYNIGSNQWLNHATKDSICASNKKVTINSPHIVEAESKSVKVVCLAINFYLPTYSWVKNGKTVSGISGSSLHIDNNVIFMAFAKKESSGNYTCIARDNWGTAAAFTYIEIYEDPSVINHSLSHQVAFGNDVCLSCVMFSSNFDYKIIWAKFDDPISSGNQKYSIVKKSFHLNKISTKLCIKSVNIEDSGLYSCEINSTIGKHRLEGKIEVFAKPEADIYETGNTLICNVSGFPIPRITWYKDSNVLKESANEEISLTIEKVDGNLTCVASNILGISSKTSIQGKKINGEDSSMLIIILCVVGALVVVAIIILCIYCYRRRRKEIVNNNYEGVYTTVRYTAAPGQLTSHPVSSSEYATVNDGGTKSRIEFKPKNPHAYESKSFGIKAKYQSLKPRSRGEWEVPEECMRLERKLGEGQFGQVWKGDILGRKGTRTVAVKMLRERSSTKERKDFINELEFMKTMSPHPNIVALVGCCTRSENVMILVEYVAGGNLKDVLLNSRGKNKDTYSNLAPFSSHFSSNDLLTFAYQIARGMSYLEQIKCVHRDLAARNVLVSNDKSCKIGDFGLARDIYAENYYRKTTGGRLPLRWMAYESIFNGITTNQSDAWSFGVVLWEIVTLGGNPYPNMNRDDVIDSLQRGYRMPKPTHCSDEVYSVMWECWQQNPDKRPTFAELTAKFLRFISLQQSFVNMDQFGEDEYVNVGSYEETDDE
ncbi:fibroblast growth factor receptor 2-like isoform X2 [Xenia sp. Carnegie-2017]|uniref:fibroblast growth factor receptor 2-like isoform X2 n=1 Tax=Xenia sp. Carnegie-2017 TaxID=2897299 RepID=UPI001F0497EF|nr:fibroblast growth factor receptor 2-like isoform X2 [Xenia sp. Carnegie-2017]